MQLAYVFWHWPAEGVGAREYERRVLAFHAALGLPGARTSRLSRAPWDGEAEAPYEDWYPVADWSGLGALEARAVTGVRRVPHDAAAGGSARGAGGVYGLVRGARPAGATASAAWLARPRDVSDDEFLAALAGAAPTAEVWRRRLVLGPAPEFVVLGAARATLPWPATETSPAPLGA